MVRSTIKLLQSDPQFVPLQITHDYNVASSESALVHWLDAGQNAFKEPFLRESMQLCLNKPFNRLFRPNCALDALPEIVANDAAIEITGFIFHVSRCGSTLLCQMLSHDPENIVLAEPEPLDSLFRIGQACGKHNLELVRALVFALARKRNAQAKRCVLKLDSWHVEFAPVLRAAFPEVPWLLLYREPSEVLASNLQVPSSQMIPGSIAHVPAGMSLLEAVQMTHQRYVAIKLGIIFNGIWQLSADPNALLLNYDALPQPGLSQALAHLKLPVPRELVAEMLTISRRDAKQPDKQFQPDSDKKRAYLDHDARHDCEQFLTPIYQRLEQRRTQND